MKEMTARLRENGTVMEVGKNPEPVNPWAGRKMPKLNGDKVVDTFVSAATVWAPSGFEKPMADKMKADFEGLNIPGTTVIVDDAGPRAGSETGNVIVDIPASPDVPAGAKAICLGFHLDRVPVRAPGVPDDEPVQIEETKDGIIRSKDARTNIAADDRTGYTAVKEALSAIHLGGIPHGRIKVIGFVREEPGLFGAKALDPKHLEGLDYGFEMDGGKVGNVIKGGAGIQRFRATITGQSAPSIRGSAGKSALLAGMEVVQTLSGNERERGQIMNISNFGAGKIGPDGLPITNVVPDTAFIAGEIRGRNAADEAQLKHELTSAFQKAEEQGVKVAVEYDVIPGFHLADNAEVVKLAEIATQAAGSKPKVMTMMGGTDANCLNEKGLPSVVLGSGAYLQHTEREYTTRNDLIRATQVVMSVIAAAASPAVAVALGHLTKELGPGRLPAQEVESQL